MVVAIVVFLSISEKRSRVNWESLRSSADAWQCIPEGFSFQALRDRCSSWLPAEELRDGEERTTIHLRHDYLMARLLCRAVLSSYTGVDPRNWSFRTGVFGKPYVAQPREFRSIHFSLTRTRGLLVCLVSRVGEVGVDAEETSTPVDVCRIAKHFLSPAEQAQLSSLTAQQRNTRFFEQWVLREAYVKGTGRGLAHSPERITIEFGEDGRPLPIDDWQFSLHHPSTRHVAATAVRAGCGTPTVPIRWVTTDGLF
jgi:4'-phosphopantetheinyl transferase